MNIIELEYPLFVISILANISLILIVLRYAPKNQNRMLFVLFGLSQTIWILINYFAVRSSADSILDMARWTIASAVPHPLLFFFYIFTFLKKDEVLKQRHAVIGLFTTLLLIYVARSPYLFTHLENVGGQLTPIAGPGMGIFGLYSFALVIASFVIIYRSLKRATGIEKAQWRFIGAGLLLTFMLVLTLNFLLAVIADETRYVNLGHLYTLPFIVFTAYAMIKHHLLNIKAIVAELTIILLNLILLIQLVNSQSVGQFVTNGLVLAGTIIVGVLLIRSVIKEVKQRLQLQIPTNKLKVANKELKILDQARAEFITMASHQLRTPPATIKWYLSALLANEFGPLNDQVREGVTKLNVTNNSMISLIDAMLNVSRIERGKLEFVFEETDLDAITAMTVDQLLPLASEKKLKLVYNKPKEVLPKIMADTEKLRQVINNLIDNAIKYTKQGEVSVSVEKTATDVVLRVRDSGKGIRPEDVKEIFGKFSRSKDSNKYSSGLGLGLFLADVIVKQHNGKIWAESPGEGKGSTFAFSIPIKNNIKPTSLVYDLTKNR